MNYENKPYLLLYKGKSWVSRLIRWQTRSKYSHAAIFIPEEGVYEAWHIGGVQKNKDWKVLHKKGTIVDVFCPTEFDKENTQKVVEFLESQVGKKYDFRSVFRFLTRQPEHPDDKDKWFCSELASMAFMRAGYCLLKRIEPWAISPALLSYSPRLNLVGKIRV